MPYGNNPHPNSPSAVWSFSIWMGLLLTWSRTVQDVCTLVYLLSNPVWFDFTIEWSLIRYLRRVTFGLFACLKSISRLDQPRSLMLTGWFLVRTVCSRERDWVVFSFSPVPATRRCGNRFVFFQLWSGFRRATSFIHYLPMSQFTSSRLKWMIQWWRFRVSYRLFLLINYTNLCMRRQFHISSISRWQHPKATYRTAIEKRLVNAQNHAELGFFLFHVETRHMAIVGANEFSEYW